MTAAAFVLLAALGAAVRCIATDAWPGSRRGTLLVNVAGALVEQPRDHVGEPFPAGRIERRAALEREAHRYGGHRCVVDEPGLDTAGTLDALDLYRARRRHLGDDGDR